MGVTGIKMVNNMFYCSDRQTSKLSNLTDVEAVLRLPYCRSKKSNIVFLNNF